MNAMLYGSLGFTSWTQQMNIFMLLFLTEIRTCLSCERSQDRLSCEVWRSQDSNDNQICLILSFAEIKQLLIADVVINGIHCHCIGVHNNKIFDSNRVKNLSTDNLDKDLWVIVNSIIWCKTFYAHNHCCCTNGMSFYTWQEY